MGGKSISSTTRKIDIVYAANDLCRDREFDNVSVGDICAAADISTSTFYRLFNGKSDIPAWYLRFATNSSIEQMGTLFTCEQAFQVMLELMQRCRFLYDSVKDTAEMNLVDRNENRRLCQCILRNLRDYHGVEIDEELELEIRWVTAAGVALSGEWLHGCLEGTPEELARIFSDCYPARLRSLLDAAPTRKPETSPNISVILALISA